MNLSKLKSLFQELFNSTLPCPHLKWRPAKISKGWAKMCSVCEVVVKINEAEFYSVFGRMPILGDIFK